MLGIAIAIASEMHKHQKDKGGKPYILHCLYVMNKCRHYGEEIMQIAIMHDLIEDTTITIAHLRTLGFSERVLGALDCLTHRTGEDYPTYIRRIAENTDAIKVKCKDLQHNSDINRMKGATQKDFDRIGKYHTAYKYLSDKLNE